MKGVLLVIAVVVMGWCGYSYFTHGRLVLPGVERSDDEQKVDALARRLSAAQSDFRSANLTAGTSGIDTTSTADDAMREVQAVLDEVRSIRPELKSAAARRKADEIERRAQTVLQRSR